MIKIAKKKFFSDSSVTFQVMDTAKFDFPVNYFNAVFDFGIIHHIRNWKNCILKLIRVLKIQWRNYS